MEALLKILRDFILEKRATADLLTQHYANAKEQGELSATYANRYKGEFDAYSYMCAEIEKFLDLIREVQDYDEKIYDVKLKISAMRREDNTEFMKVEESTDCVFFESSTLKIFTYDRVLGDKFVPKSVHQLHRGDIYKIEIEFKP